MTKTTKQWIFYSAVVVFAILSYTIVLYAQGYKYSFSEGKFFRTGAIFVKANEDANVYLGDKFLNTTSFFGNSYTISGLLPGQYTVRLQRDNFSSWHKKITVEEGLVNDYSRIIILPQSGEDKEKVKTEIKTLLILPKKSPQPTPTPPPTGGSKEPFYIKNGVLFRNVDGTSEKLAPLATGFSLSSDNRKISWWNDSEIWIMWLSDTDYQPFHKAGDKDLITRFSIKIKNANWFRGSDHVVVDSNGYKVVEIDKRGGLNIIEI